MRTANTLMGRGKCVELLQPGTPIPESHSAVLQMILALPAAHLGDSTSFLNALEMRSLWKTKWGILG